MMNRQVVTSVCLFTVLQPFRSGFEREQIRLRAESRNDADGQIRKVRMFAEWLAGVDITHVYFNEWNLHRRQCITNHHAGVRERAWIDQNKVGVFAQTILDASTQKVLGIALHVRECEAKLSGVVFQCGVDLPERGGAVDVGLALAKQIEVGAVQYEEFGHKGTVFTKREGCSLWWTKTAMSRVLCLKCDVRMRFADVVGCLPEVCLGC